MILQLKKFGATLISRPSGKECYNAILPELKSLPAGEKIIIDFDGVNTFSPSWADEFLTPLKKEFGARLVLQESPNLSVKTTIKLLEQIGRMKF